MQQPDCSIKRNSDLVPCKINREPEILTNHLTFREDMAELLGVHGSYLHEQCRALFVLCGEVQWKSHHPATDSQGRGRGIAEENAFS